MTSCHLYRCSVQHLGIKTPHEELKGWRLCEDAGVRRLPLSQQAERKIVEFVFNICLLPEQQEPAEKWTSRLFPTHLGQNASSCFIILFYLLHVQKLRS